MQLINHTPFPAMTFEARDRDDRLASVTLFAAQVDFKDAGELTIFIDEGQLSSLDESMRERGVLDASQMVGAFVALRAGDLQWGRGMHQRCARVCYALAFRVFCRM